MQNLRLLVGSLLLVLAAGCSTEKIAGNTTDAVVFIGKTALKGVVGAGKLAAKGAAAVVRKLREPTDGYKAGTIVCLDQNDDIYAAVEEQDGDFVCPRNV